jgi:hypothetical protein
MITTRLAAVTALIFISACARTSDAPDSATTTAPAADAQSTQLPDTPADAQPPAGGTDDDARRTAQSSEPATRTAESAAAAAPECKDISETKSDACEPQATGDPTKK